MKKSILFAAAVWCGALCANAQNLENGHEWVDLGLPSGLKWATCNVGAAAPEEYGDYYAWGETEAIDTTIVDSWDHYYDTIPCSKYVYYNLDFGHDGAPIGDRKVTKYCNDADYGLDGFIDDKTVLEPEDDAASANWGGTWRMPTEEECKELIDNCDWTWTDNYNGTNVAGSIVKSRINGSAVFLPADSTIHYSYGIVGEYWTSSLAVEEAPSKAMTFAFFQGHSIPTITGGVFRDCGFFIRPVCEVSSPITALQHTENVAIYAENGRIVCEQDFQIYDLLGRNVTKMNGSLNGVYIVKCGEKAVKIVARSQSKE